ncbi:hypothetical protein Rs2_26872 [Raphanus sativus]|nr:hypothetical protein Rs2_26872 [Raphanus sativus]
MKYQIYNKKKKKGKLLTVKKTRREKGNLGEAAWLPNSSNPDLRRKVLLGEISGERLVTMKKEEMASDKIQIEVQRIKERARDKEENRMKSMMMFQSGSMIMT